MEEVSRHRCIIYEGAPSVHLPVVAAEAAGRLNGNHRCWYLNTPPMIAGFRTYLSAEGVDVGAAVARGALVLSSDQDHLVNGAFDPDRMLEALRSEVQKALTDGYAGLWASGDMLWELGGERNLPKLLVYEAALEELLCAEPALSGVCQYHRDVLPSEAVLVGLYTHQAVYINETFQQLNPTYRETAVLRREPSTNATDHVRHVLAQLEPNAR